MKVQNIGLGDAPGPEEGPEDAPRPDVGLGDAPSPDEGPEMLQDIMKIKENQ